MAEPFVAEIRAVAFNFPPTGWAACDGQILPISQNTALFSLLGTIYGGNGKSTFALPDLQGRAPMQQGQGPGLSLRDLGETGGSATVTLLADEIPQHTHGLLAASGNATTNNPTNNVWATTGTRRTTSNTYTNVHQSGAAMSPAALSTAGSSQPHNNMPPYLALNFVIALQGVYPPRG